MRSEEWWRRARCSIEPIQSRGIHHLDLVVSDVERSRGFYSHLLRLLGWGGVLELTGERGERRFRTCRRTTPGSAFVGSSRTCIPFRTTVTRSVSTMSPSRRPRGRRSMSAGSGSARRMCRPRLPPRSSRTTFPATTRLLLRSGWDQARSRPRAHARRDNIRLEALGAERCTYSNSR